MKIAVVCEPGQGGVKRYMMEQVFPLLSELGTNAIFVYSKARVDSDYLEAVEKMERLGVKCFEIQLKPQINIFWDCVALLRLTAILWSESPDLLHTHSSKAGAVGRFVAPFLRCRCLHSPHGLASDRNHLFWLIELLLAQITYRFVAVSEGERRRIAEELAIDLSKIEVHNPYVKQPKLTPRECSSEAVSVVSCGRLCSDKNPMMFLRVAERVCVLRDEVQFVWVGDGEDSIAMSFRNSLARSQFRRRISLTGWVSHPEAVFSSCDVLVMFSRNESFCYSVADGIAMGLRCVLSPVSGLRDYLDEFGELCSPALNEDDAVKALLRAIDQVKAINGAVSHHTVTERFLEKHSLSRSLECLKQFWERALPAV